MTDKADRARAGCGANREPTEMSPPEEANCLPKAVAATIPFQRRGDLQGREELQESSSEPPSGRLRGAVFGAQSPEWPNLRRCRR